MFITDGTESTALILYFAIQKVQDSELILCVITRKCYLSCVKLVICLHLSIKLCNYLN